MMKHTMMVFVLALTVAAKEAVTPQVAHRIHLERVCARLSAATTEALDDLENASLFAVGSPVNITMRFSTTTRADILQAIPTMRRVDGFTVQPLRLRTQISANGNPVAMNARSTSDFSHSKMARITRSSTMPAR